MMTHALDEIEHEDVDPQTGPVLLSDEEMEETE